MNLTNATAIVSTGSAARRDAAIADLAALGASPVRRVAGSAAVEAEFTEGGTRAAAAVLGGGGPLIERLRAYFGNRQDTSRVEALVRRATRGGYGETVLVFGDRPGGGARLERTGGASKRLDAAGAAAAFADPEPVLVECAARGGDVTNLKKDVVLRPHQAAALAAVFDARRPGRARSGVVVLPCGAGKTLVGVAASARLGGSCLVLCTGTESARQWRAEFLRWRADLGEDDVALARDGDGNDSARPRVVVATYQVLARGGPRASALARRAWDAVVLDEVHVAPAETFARALAGLTARLRLGLTATPLREDARVRDLDVSVGPVLHESRWDELVAAGVLADVTCVQVSCPMSPPFFRAHLRAADASTRRRLRARDPVKARVCAFLVDRHVRGRDDRVLVFGDDVAALKRLAVVTGNYVLTGETPDHEREAVLGAFRRGDAGVRCLFMSRMGDTSLDLPDASVVIQLTGHGASRRQETQRLGRLTRPSADKGLCFFYDLVCADTPEEAEAGARRAYLEGQGYVFGTGSRVCEAAGAIGEREGDAALLEEALLGKRPAPAREERPAKKKPRRNPVLASLLA